MSCLLHTYEGQRGKTMMVKKKSDNMLLGSWILNELKVAFHIPKYMGNNSYRL